MKFRIDLHTHSKFSGDNYSEPEDYIVQALKLNLDGIAFTEHYSYEASDLIEKLIEKYRGTIQIFRGLKSLQQKATALYSVSTLINCRYSICPPRK